MFKKPKWLKNIKVLVWDLDGTLYRENAQMQKEIKDKVYHLIAQARKIPLEEAKKIFEKTYAQYKSNTLSLIKLGVAEKKVKAGYWFYASQLKYLTQDWKIKKMFVQLKQYPHILHTNSPRAVTLLKLRKLGLNKSIFAKIFTTDEMGQKIKPHPAAFKLILQFTKLKPNQHLLVGDSEGKEMIPAAKLDFHTCFVWGKSKYSDISLSQVYDVISLFS